jgi:glutamyl-tRNA synthetase
MPLRIALVGHGQSPAVNLTLRLLGRERALARIERVMAYVAAEPA